MARKIIVSRSPFAGRAGRVLLPPVAYHPAPAAMFSHDIDYSILGTDIQVLEVELDPNETVVVETMV